MPIFSFFFQLLFGKISSDAFLDVRKYQVILIRPCNTRLESKQTIPLLGMLPLSYCYTVVFYFLILQAISWSAL